MGNAVGGLRDRFYRDLRREYRDEGVNSFLYRYFWTEAVTELLEEYVPQFPAECPLQPENSSRIRALLEEAVRERPELLLRPAPEKKRRKPGEEAVRDKDKTERRDFWEELWLNDAGYQADLISDTDYYLWLVEYLAARDLYYKDTSMWDGRRWLDKLLREGWLGAGEVRVPGLWRQKSGRAVPSTTQTGADLRELAKQIKTDREAVAFRLHELEVEGEDYLPWLTGRLKQMALHIKIKDWLQNSGYPLIKEGDMSARFSAKRARKQDFSMRLLEAYCDSGRGGGFLRQYSKDKKQGFLLGYERYGRLCFQAGTGEDWLTLWAEDGNLNKYEWNHVAAVFDGKAGSMSLYLNGESVGEKSVAAGSAIAPAEREKLLVGKNAHSEVIAAGAYNMFSISWELPILLPLTNRAGTITKYFFCISPAPASLADNKAYYFVGDFDKETGKFIPDERFDKKPALLDYGSNVFTGPSALVDPVSGSVYLFSNTQDGTISGKNPNKTKEANHS